MRVHLLRPSIPWRDERVTMCGRQVGETYKVVELEQFARTRLSRQCGSCTRYPGAGRRHWTESIQNELLRGFNNQRPRKIVAELEAIKDLVERHRAEFDSLLAANLAADVIQESEDKGGGHWQWKSDWTVIR